MSSTSRRTRSRRTWTRSWTDEQPTGDSDHGSDPLVRRWCGLCRGGSEREGNLRRGRQVTQLVPVQLFERGYTDLISVIPPGATLSPGSKIASNSLGKAPGIKYANGTWGGYNWRQWAASEADVAKWANDGANIGLRAGTFPGLDIDSMNAAVVEAVKQIAFETLGPAPVRTGKAPKALLMYYTSKPFTRMRMWLEGEKEVHLIEMLGEGQQYLVHGTHPGTMRPYAWNQEVPIADALHSITVESAHFLFAKIKQNL